MIDHRRFSRDCQDPGLPGARAAMEPGDLMQPTGQEMPASVPENFLQDDEETWEFELDLLGTSATPEQLQEMLARAPNPKSATVDFIKGYLAGYVNHGTQNT
jgi:hypothetical protein